MKTSELNSITVFLKPLKERAPSRHIGSDYPKWALSREAAMRNPLNENRHNTANEDATCRAEHPPSTLSVLSRQRPVQLCSSPATVDVCIDTPTRTTCHGKALPARPSGPSILLAKATHTQHHTIVQHSNVMLIEIQVLKSTNTNASEEPIRAHLPVAIATPAV